MDVFFGTPYPSDTIYSSPHSDVSVMYYLLEASYATT